LNNKSIKLFKIKRNIKVKLWARLTQENEYTQYFMHSCFSVAISSYHFKSLKHLLNSMRVSSWEHSRKTDD
jgi:hypothetical protein